MPSYARQERKLLCDLMEQLGPDAPTLCAGWSARDLAGHLIIRESRPDALPGILLPPFSSYTDRVQNKVVNRPFEQVISTLRKGPPLYSPYHFGPIDKAVNTMEMFIHHEDVRRAQPDWEPRQLDRELEKMLWSRFRMMRRLLFRKVGVPLRIEPRGFRPVGSMDDSQCVILSGEPSELIMFATGRKDHAIVEIRGRDEMVAALKSAPMGI